MTNQRKFNVLLEGSVINRSGYGNWVDQIALATISYPYFNTLIAPLNWGSCPSRLTINDNDNIITRHILKQREVQQPDIYISCTMPHHIKPQGRIFNINFCAGLEVDKCPDDFMTGANLYDLNITMSKHSKLGYENSRVKPIKPIEVFHWGMDTDIFKPDTTTNPNIEEGLNNIPEKECFLFVGQNTSQHLFLDRKNISNLVKDFCEAFKGKPNKPGLILKTSGVGFSTFDRDECINRIQQVKSMVPDCDVNVYLVHGELTDIEMNALYNHSKVIAFISETRGEGWGGSLLQFSMVGKPIFAPNWSGHLDFLDNRAILLAGQLETLPPQANSQYYMPGSRWFEVDHTITKQKMLDYVYGDRTQVNKLTKELAIDNSKKFNLNQMEKQLHAIYDKHILGKI